MKRVAENTYSLGTIGHNFYLMVDQDQVTVIDAGCSGEWRKLKGALIALGLSLDAVAGIAATHSHADHFGLARRASDSGIAVSVHEDEESRALGTYEGRFGVAPSELPFFSFHSLKAFVPMVVAGIRRLDHLEQVETFQDGDQLDLPGRPVAIHTPGHTEGHTMFLCPDRGLLFTGDGLITMNLIGPGKGPQVIERRFNLVHDQTVESLDRIVEVEADLLLPGHGQPWAGAPAEAVAMARG